MLAFLMALLGGGLGLVGLVGGGGGGGDTSPDQLSPTLDMPPPDPAPAPVAQPAPPPSIPEPDDIGAAPDDMANDPPEEDGMGDDDEMPNEPIGRPQDQGGMNDMPDHGGMDDMPQDGGMDDMPDHGGMGDMPQHGGMDDMPDHAGMDDMPDHGGMGDMPQDGGMDDMPGDHGSSSQGDHNTHDNHGGHGNHRGHGDHGTHGSNVDLPTTPAEIAAFVAGVRSAEEKHVHDHGDDRMGEHMQVMDLVDPATATHIAIGHGSWFDPSNWHNGEVPGDGAKVVIPDGVYLEYDQQSDARLFTVRVDGQLDFATDANSTMVVDTLIVAPGGVMTAGTADDPVEADVTVEIIIANNGAIDTNWDPGLFSRGVISHGKTEIRGAEKDSHEKVADDPMAGDTSLRFETLPEGWQVGDKIVIAGTRYDGEVRDDDTGEIIRQEPEDEVRIISEIRGNEVFFEEPLVHDHDSPRADLKTSVANYSRNVTIKSEDGEDSEIFARGHVMLMHSDDVDVSYAAFEELGRTDKSVDLHDSEDDGAPDFDSNVAGRYGLHIHRTGTGDENDPTLLTGNAVFGSPGWGIVHHDSHAHIVGNATYDTFGAGFVAESGNETGLWADNIAIDAEGREWSGAKGVNDKINFDVGRSGDGFWFQGRMVASHDNIAASVNHGFVYFHRGDDGNANYDAALFELPDALHYDDNASAQTTPILTFSNNEAFASRIGLHVVKANANQGHDVSSVFEGFTAWEVDHGANFQYTANYVLKDFDLIGNSELGSNDNSFQKLSAGISFGKNIYDFSIINPKIDGFYSGIEFEKNFSVNAGQTDVSDHEYVVVNPQITNVVQDFDEFDPVYDIVIDRPVAEKPVTLELEGPLRYDGATRIVEIRGTKTDSLGTEDYPHGPDNFDLDRDDIRNILEQDGYFMADDGHRYITHKLYLSDSLTGDIYAQPIMIELDDELELGGGSGAFGDAIFKGNVAVAELEELTSQPPHLIYDSGRFEADGSIKTVSPAALDIWQALTIEHGMHSDTVMAPDEDEDHQTHEMMH
ncbi:MAG: G8 domain-containing protein [Pseudomonadota bacterium]